MGGVYKDGLARLCSTPSIITFMPNVGLFVVTTLPSQPVSWTTLTMGELKAVYQLFLTIAEFIKTTEVEVNVAPKQAFEKTTTTF